MDPLTIDRHVLERFRRGDGSAFARVMRVHCGLVRHIVSGFFRDPFGQEEAMQEVWLLAYRQREKLDPDRLEQFTGWLSVLAKRRCIDLLRRGRGRSDHEAAVDPAVIEGRSAAAADQQTEAETQSIKDALEAFQARLRPQWRAFFELHFLQGLGYPEIATRLSISRIRCKYMKRVLVAKARKNRGLLEVLGRLPGPGGGDVR